MTTDNLATIVLSLVGSGFLSTVLTHYLQKKSTSDSAKQEFKETRYKCIILLMHACLDFERSNTELSKHGRNFHSLDDLLDEIRAEWHNMILFASDSVLQTTQEFIATPNSKTFYKAALAMRSDLWGGKLSFHFEQIDIKSLHTSSSKNA